MKLGIFLTDLGLSQLSFYVVREVNNFLRQNKQLSVTLFCENIIAPPSTPMCAVMQINDAYCFDGITVATSISTAEKLLHIPGPRHRFYYLWDLEWIRPLPIHYASIQATMVNPEVKLITRHQDHATIVKNSFNRESIGNIEDFRMDELMKLIEANSD